MEAADESPPDCGEVASNIEAKPFSCCICCPLSTTTGSQIQQSYLLAVVPPGFKATTSIEYGTHAQTSVFLPGFLTPCFDYTINLMVPGFWRLLTTAPDLGDCIPSQTL